MPTSLFNSDTTLTTRFEAIANTYPDATAVSDAHCDWTYRELHRRALHVASDLGTSPGVIGILLPCDAHHIAAVLGVLFAGGIYLSLDPGYPEARLRAMLAAADVTQVITTPANEALARRLGASPLLASPDNEPFPVIAAPDTTAESFAALYFTSGSTGEPKAIVHTHRNILFDSARQARDLAVNSTDRFDLLFSPSFSAFLSPVFGALLTGASVHLLDLKQQPVAILRDWLDTHAITLSTMSVSTFRRLIAITPCGQRFASLRLLSLGAEPLTLRDLEQFQQHTSPDCLLQNALATTETRTLSQALLRADAPLPDTVSLGQPVDGKTLLLLNETGNPVTSGEVGEIVIESRYISPGTWDQLRHLPGHRLTAPRTSRHATGDLGRFLPDGNLLHLGRKDHQIKLRGHRIEAVEIENALLAHPAVSNAAVFLLNGEPDQLTALLVASGTAGLPPPNDWRHYLSTTLPDWMLPDRYAVVDTLPLTPSGKLNRRLLPDWYREHCPSPEHDDSIHPTSASDDPLFQIWQKVLGRTDLHPNEDFFTAGGDSLAAVELMAAVSRHTGQNLPLSLLAEATTYETFKTRLQAPDIGKAGPVLIPLLPGGDGEPLYLIPPWNHSGLIFRDFTRLPPGGRPVWALECFDPPDSPSPADDLGKMARVYAEFLHQRHPDGAFSIGGFSMGGLIAWEAARLLLEKRSPCRHVYLLDSSRFFTALSAKDQSWVHTSRNKWGRLFLLARLMLRPRGLNRRRLLSRTFGGTLRFLKLAPPLPIQPHDPFERAFLRNYSLSRLHQVRPAAIPATLVRASQQSEWENVFSADLGWNPICQGPFRIETIACSHLDLIRTPQSARLLTLFSSTAASPTSNRRPL